MKEKTDIGILTKVKDEMEKMIEELLKKGVKPDDISMLYKMIDIHKDVKNEDYWKAKEDNMRYMYGRNSYGRDAYEDSYGRRRRDSRGRFMESGASAYKPYGADGAMEDVYQNYREYSEGKEQYGRGYGAKEDTMRSLKYMLESVVCFFEMLKEDAGSQEESELIKKYARQISEM